ncbi:class I SAM-dependent methyltransferase [Herminiimonas arsenitoxidans]|uniref:class I SAM-dependent methyltransferase n=1 Tax=Herminiimonas arsenitoxidans TaxID=1809410 RepID=UPI000970428E|nr:class I SAM-dependent methyltransferase [Herminiimonas arsenitoxidans]
MRVTYRTRGAKEYWTARWEDIPADMPMKNLNAYPLKYAEMIVKNPEAKILEAGCGAGRILRYYHNKGYNIIGIDYIDVAIKKLEEIDNSLKVSVGDIANLQFSDQSFDCALAFGLYHNIENGLDAAISETYRVIKHGGAVCASFRADNIQTRLTDWLSDRRSKTKNDGKVGRSFHKMNLTKKEYRHLFERAGFFVEAVFPVENMPILYKFRVFRASSQKVFNEERARVDGYRLSWLGQRLQKFLMRFFAHQFCNIYVIIARKF